MREQYTKMSRRLRRRLVCLIYGLILVMIVFFLTRYHAGHDESNPSRRFFLSRDRFGNMRFHKHSVDPNESMKGNRHDLLKFQELNVKIDEQDAVIEGLRRELDMIKSNRIW